jgi:hypothetical protein
LRHICTLGAGPSWARFTPIRLCSLLDQRAKQVPSVRQFARAHRADRVSQHAQAAMFVARIGLPPGFDPLLTDDNLLLAIDLSGSMDGPDETQILTEQLLLLQHWKCI